MLSLRNLTSFVALPSRSKPSSPSLRRRLVRSRLTEAATFAPLDVVGVSERAIGSLTELQNGGSWKVEDELPPAEDGREGGVEDDDPEEEEEGISSIHVPREKYINVAKSDLVNGIVTKLLDPQDGDADLFLLLSSCLDSILHAEHKRILEQMRADFVATQSLEQVKTGGDSSSDEESFTSDGENDSEEELNSDAKKSEPRSVNGYEGLLFPLADGFDIWNFLISSGKHAKKRSAERKHIVPERVALMQRANKSDKSGYESLLRVYRETDLSQEKTRILGSLASCPDTTIVQDVLNFVLSDEVRNQDAFYGLSGVSWEGREVAWKWLQEKWEYIGETWGSGFLITRFISAIVSPFASFEKAKEVEQFFATRSKPSTIVGSGQGSLAVPEESA